MTTGLAQRLGQRAERRRTERGRGMGRAANARGKRSGDELHRGSLSFVHRDRGVRFFERIVFHIWPGIYTNVNDCKPLF